MTPLRRAVAVPLVICLLVLPGCGSSDTPGERVPELADILTSVDDSLAEEQYRQARRHLRRLVATTEDARAAGDLAEGEADRVLAAAARLLAVLPAGTRTSPTQPDGESVTPPQSQEPEVDEGDEGNGGSDEANRGSDEEAKKLEEERKKLEEERKKLEEELKKQEEERAEQEEDGGGNGDSSENGPDDGHGN